MGTSVSRACTAQFRTIIAAVAAFTLTLGLAPLAAFGSESVAGGFTPPEYEGDAHSASSNSSNGSEQSTVPQVAASSGSTPMLASTLAGSAASIVSADVALDAAEPIIGSFTVDGLTYVVNNGEATLVSVGATFVVAPYEGPADSGDGDAIVLPSTVTCNGTTYPVMAIGPYAFYLSGATDVSLPDSIVSVDDRAFRSSDVSRVDVAPDNPNLASFDGVLYSADLSSLLLIPEGRAGAVLLPETTEVVQASKFSHCSLVDAISVEEGGADFASWDGLLYDASGTTLLRVPAGATDITVRDGCTTIAAGALEGCAKLERINAPTTVTSISPDVFESVPTVSVPISLLEGASREDASQMQVSALVRIASNFALSSDGASPGIDSSTIAVLAQGKDQIALWSELGFSIEPVAESMDSVAPSLAAVEDAASSYASTVAFYVDTLPSGRAEFPYTLISYQGLGQPTVTQGGIAPTFSFAGSTSRDKLRFSVSASQEANGDCIFDGEIVYNPGNYQKHMTSNYPGVTIADGYTYAGYMTVGEGQEKFTTFEGTLASVGSDVVTVYLNLVPNEYKVSFDLNSQIATSEIDGVTATFEQPMPRLDALPRAATYKFLGFWNKREGGIQYYSDAGESLSDWDIPNDGTLYAQWERVDFDVGFDTDSEPDDVDYPGEAKPDETINVDSGAVPIEDPKRPGYVFEGWVIPSADGTEAIDQELVYQGDDGKWYVDASKLPDYANDDGKVQLTARWTSVISVDVPQSVTFYADAVTKGQESREGAASSAFGQSKVANQSQVDLRVVGLESSAVKTEGSTLGADSILKKADAATPSTSTQKLLSLYPSAKQWTADELQDPDAVGGTKATTAVDFDLDDILLEKSFSADAFTIPAGDTLNMGYRLNLSETGQQLDYDKLSTLEDGQSAAIANVSYCFAAGHMHGSVTGSVNDDIYIEYDGKVYGMGDILGAADCISELGEASPCYPIYDAIMRAQGVPSNGYLPADAGAKVYAKYTGPEATADQPNCKREGYVRLLLVGINHDALELSVAPGAAYDFESQPSKRAGLTFQFMDALIGGLAMNLQGETTAGGWRESHMRTSTLASDGPVASALAIYPHAKDVWKFSNKVGGGDAGVGGADAAYAGVIGVTQDRLFLPSYAELAGAYVYPGRDLWLSHEGAQYAYWGDVCGVVANDPRTENWERAIKLGGDGTPQQWWTRLARIEPNGFCNVMASVKSTGVGWDHLNQKTEMSIAPAFCL